MRKFLASLALLMISAEFCAVTTAAESPQPMPRGSARIIGLVVPDFPDKLVREGSSLEIPLSLAVDDDGHVTEVVLESSPSTIDAAIRNAVSHWFVIPAICSDSKWTSKTVRTRIVFSLEEGKQIVTLKDPRWYAIGPDEVLPGAGTGNPSSSTIKMRQPLAKPEFPREAMRRGIDKGVVAAVIQFDPDGNVTEIVRMFQWPPRVFERAVREAVMQWKAAPEEEALLKGEPFRACFDVTFTMR